MKINIFETQNKYSIIYADPPWTFKTYSSKGKEKKSAECHYPCIKKEDIQNLPVAKLAERDCVLFLWVTFPCLEEGLELIKKWGFVYKTCGFNWIKKNKKSDSLFWGLGYWTRANSELCLIATKGNPKRVSKSVHQVIMTPIEQHSKKPEIVRTKIKELCGDVASIELFARQYAEGWDCWGNEV